MKAMTRLTNPSIDLPRKFNSVEKWSSFISEVPDQGWCGSSWVLSTTSVASDRFAIQSQGKEVVQLSPQNILSCTRRQQGCEGGHLDAAWRYLHKKGVVDETCYPYTQRKDNCKIRHNSRSLKANGCRPAYGVNRDSFYTVGPAYSLSREADIMAEIYHSGPVQATMRVYRDFFSYSGGVYRHTAANRGAPTGFHSVKIVGWGEEHDGVKYWVSWAVSAIEFPHTHLFLYRLRPIRGVLGGASMVTSAYCAAPMSAASRNMCWPRGPMCTTTTTRRRCKWSRAELKSSRNLELKRSDEQFISCFKIFHLLRH